jgi:hypothetical protein
MFKTKNINRDRFFKIQRFLDYGFLGDGIVLAGGALRTLVDDTDIIQDFDLFFLGEEEEYKLKKDAIEEKIINGGGSKVFQCKEDELRSFVYNGDNIQLISIKNKKHFSVESLLDSFDINACRFAYYQDFLFFTKASVEDIKRKHISINIVAYPVATLKRICKYKEKGFKITLAAKEFVRQVAANSLEMDLETVYVD